MTDTVAAGGSPSEPPRWGELLIQMMTAAARDWTWRAFLRLLLLVAVIASTAYSIVALLVLVRG